MTDRRCFWFADCFVFLLFFLVGREIFIIVLGRVKLGARSLFYELRFFFFFLSLSYIYTYFFWIFFWFLSYIFFAKQVLRKGKKRIFWRVLLLSLFFVCPNNIALD